MADKNHPRRGSLAYKPQTRANRLYPALGLPEDADVSGAGGFAGYKTGMTRVLRIDDEDDSPTKGQEVADAVTVVECPPLRVYGARAYHMTPDGEQPYTDVFAGEIRDELARRQNVPSEGGDTDAISDSIADISDIRLLVHTRPQQAGIGKKTPEAFELPVGGSVEEQWGFVEERLGGEVRISEVLDPGQYVDVLGVTKGKGFQGPVKRHGVKKLPRKTQKSQRKAGNIGPWHPDHTSWKVPQPGRTGANQRTELNKRILMLDDDTEQVNPGGGFKHYGEVQSDYVLVKGSVPGPAKRLIMFRPAVRNREYPENPEITHIEA